MRFSAILLIVLGLLLFRLSAIACATLVLIGLFVLTYGEKTNPNCTYELKKVGSEEPFCPSCGIAFKKIPQKKTKCQNCNEYVFVRTRPIDNKRVFLLQRDLEVLEEQWAIKQGNVEEYLAAKAEYEHEREALSRRFGKPASDSDVEWSLCNKRIIEHAKAHNWGLYRNVKFSMAEFLRKEKRSKDALMLYLEVAYIDLNGPCNRGHLASPELSLQFPEWDLQFALLAPGVMAAIAKMLDECDIDISDLEEDFSEMARRTNRSLKLPVPEMEAWLAIKKELV
jgi:DNA-directed RNA polymerase subunit RPC12/RpoP